MNADCQVTAADLDFGTYNPDSLSNASTPLNIRCTPGTAATISLSSGASGNPQSRYMSSGANHLTYQLYRDAGRTDPINTTGMAFQLTSGANTGAVVTYTIYGQIPAAQWAAAGNYTDVIQVTVQF